MVDMICGYDKAGKKIFERKAREYDQRNIGFMGITVSDLIKSAPVFVACIVFYTNTINFQKSQQEFNNHVLILVQQNSDSVSSLKDVLANLNNYLSAKTGRQFKDGMPTK